MDDASTTCMPMSPPADLAADAASPSAAETAARLAMQYRQIAFAYAVAVLRQKEDAEDVVQEAIVRAIRAAPRYRAEEAWAPWFMAIVRNLCRDHLRKRRTRTAAPLDKTIPDPNPTPEFALMLNERNTMLAAAVQSLKDAHRIPLMMHYTLGLTLDETALALGLRRSTVVGRIAAALRILRRAMTERSK